MNYRQDLANIYESIIINEIAGAINYWLLPDGSLVRVDDHINYALQHIIPDDEYRGMREEDLYEVLLKKGYLRIVEDSANVYFGYVFDVKPTKKQFMELFGLANDKNKNLIDGLTGATIIKNNESRGEFRDNEQVKQMDRELQPSFYRDKGRYSESYEHRFALNDYSKLIEEGASGHGDEKAVRELIKWGLTEGLIKNCEATNKGWMLKSAKDDSQCLIHKGERSLHYLRRYLQRLEKL